MSSDDGFQIFRPKVLRGNISNLTQMSTTSSVPSGGRLSLSSRAPVRSKCQTPSKSASSIPRTPISKQKPLQVTPKSSSRKSTSRKTPPSDGLSQKKIDSYFSSTFRKPETPKRSNCALIDLVSDSSEDENVFQDDHNRFKLSSVSRELFPAKSVVNSCSESNKNLALPSDANIQNKENRNFTLQNTSTPKSFKGGNIVKDVPKSPLVYKVTSTVASNGSKILKLAKKKPESVQDSAITKNNLLQTSTEHMANGEDLSPNILNPVECGHNSTDKTVTAPSRFPARSKSSKNLDRNAKNLALAENPQGKNKCYRKGTTEDTDNSHLSKNDQHVTCKNTSPASKEILSSQMPSTSTSIPCHIDFVGNNDAVPVSSEKDLFDNFTGVTECVPLQSSGEIWQPSNRICSDSSSDDFESEDVIRNKSGENYSGRKNRRKRKTLKTKGNKDKGARRSKDAGNKNKEKVPKGHEGARSSKDLEKSISKKPVEAKDSNIETSINQNSVGTIEKPCCEHIPLDAELDNGETDCSGDVQENFKLSGGFFPEDENLKRPMGHAFDMRTPSIEYLDNLSPLLDENYIAEDQVQEGGDTDMSSEIADLSALDQHCDDSITKGEEAVTLIPGEHDKIEIHNHSIHSRSTDIALKKSNEIINYQENLLGVSLSVSEWDKLLDQQNVNESNDVDLINYSDREHMSGSTCVSLPKNNSENRSKSFKRSDIGGDCGEVVEKSLRENTPRSCSPQEAEEAPSDVELYICSTQKAHQPHVSPEKRISCTSDKSCFSPQITYLMQELNQNEKCLPPQVSSSERVHEWISQVQSKSSVREGNANNALSESTSVQSRTLVKERDDKIQQTNSTDCRSDTGMHFLMQNNRDGLTSNVNQCNVNSQVKIYIKYDSMNERVVKKVNKVKCKERNACHDNDKFRCEKTAASFNVEVSEARERVTEKDKSSYKKKAFPGKQLSQVRSDEYFNDDRESYDVQRRPVKVNIKLGKWGWKELSIDCVPEKNRNDRFCSESDSILGEDTPMILCIQEVHINMCNCSRSMQIICIISKEKMTEANRKCIYRSRYRTSLQEHVGHWGNPENPLTLSMTAYSVLSSNEDLDSSSIPFSEKETIILNDNQQELGLMDNLRSNKDKSSEGLISRNDMCTNSIQNQMEKLKENGRKSKQGMVTDSQVTYMSGMSCHEYTAATPSGLSDNFQERMTSPPQDEFSKPSTAAQWKDIMKVMRSGKYSSSRSTDSSNSTRSHSSASSVSSVSYQYKRNQGYYNRSSEKRNCPFYKLIEGTKFAVDAFSYGTIPGVTHYFLSHFHYDHYMGLNKKFSHPIYCSSVTAKLISLKIKLNPSLIRRIDPGQMLVVDNTKITALDANHCPGSLMLLFELPGGKKHLHVGDFRAHPCMESYHALWNIADIDRLYLDTTYCDPVYTFPSQHEAIESILTIVEEAIANEPKTLIVCGTYTIGKERVFAAVAESLKTKIWAPADKRQVLLCVKEGLQDLSSFNNIEIDGGAGRELGIANALKLLTTIKEEAQVHVLSMKNLTVKFLEEHLEKIKGMKFNNVLAFCPTGWAHGRSGKGKDANLVNSSSLVKIYEVAYSEHSSFLEMARFVQFVRPKSVIKTVNVGSEQQRQAMEKHINTWLSQVKSKFPLPNRYSDSPKTFQVTEEQKKAGVFQPKNGKRMFEMRSSIVNNATTHLPLMGDYSENSYDNMRTASLPTQILSCRSQENQTENESFQAARGVKRMHPYNAEGPCKKRLS